VQGGAILDDLQRSQQQHPISRQARHFHDHSNARSNEDSLPQEAPDIFWLLGKLAQAEPCPEKNVQRNQSFDDRRHHEPDNPSGEAIMISAAFPYKKQRRKVLGREMAYVEVGKGDPIVFLHGNPTSSYLWRNVIPHLEPLGRCIAPDLIGMGDSEKLPDSGPGSYRFVEHRRYLGALLEALNVRERVTLVIHDWGSTLGFDWANHHRDAVRGIAYMEAMVGRQYWDHWDKFGMRPVLQALRSEAGEQMVLQDNFFIEKVLPGAILRKLSDEEMAEYRRPFTEPGEGRRPTLTFPREIPIEGDPADVTTAVDAYADWLKSSSVPKLFVRAEPGGILADGKVLELARSLPAQTELTVKGVHFVQEDSPDEIGRAIAAWMKTLG
jgi:haloalkane dehalogenase